MRETRPDVGVTAAAGFLASAVRAGLRREGDDVALVVSERRASAAAVFTTNQVQAAPVVVSRAALALSGGVARAVVLNAGCANACTGERGLEAARLTARETAERLRVPDEHVLVASTGVIGQQLDAAKLVAALPAALAGLSADSGAAAAKAIMTTDTRRKEAGRRVGAGASSWIVGGMAKGAGMIAPDMATTLAVVTTDAAADPDVLRRCLVRAVGVSFNRITVDGDTSTNDMVALLANGASGVTPPEAELEEALADVLVSLARQVARDGEGAERLVTVDVTGGVSDEAALQVARTIANSLLVKTAVHGADANWGRIVAAAGRSGVRVRPELFTVGLGDVVVLKPGYVSDHSDAAATAELRKDEVLLRLDLGEGAGSARVWTCDLSPEYVRVNASYRS